jgi:type IV secretion system protein TrbL
VTGRAAGATPQVLGPIGPVVGHLFGGLAGGAIKTVLAAIVRWADEGAADALRFTASLIGSSTEPALQTTWFSATYWRVAALSALLTVPFLFAAAVHAIVRSDLALLGRAAFGYLPLAMLGVGIAAPLTGLVVSATDEMCTWVAAAGGHADTTFLGHAATAITAASVIARDPFIAFFAGVITVAATLALWVELLIRAAAVDVIVLMLPLFFAAMVWPARRVWAIRAIETLIALILAKFGIIAVLTLGGAALTDAASGLDALLTGATLVLLATLSPWALLRLLPLHEVAAAAAGGLSDGPRRAMDRVPLRLAAGEAGPPVDEAEAAGLGIGDVPGLDDGPRNLLARFARDPRPTAGGSPGDDLSPEEFDPETAAGIAAVENAGRGSFAAGAVTAADDETPVGSAAPPAPSEKPPLPEMFRPGIFNEPIVLGDGVTERMGSFVTAGEAARPTGGEPQPGDDPSPDRIAGPSPDPAPPRHPAPPPHPDPEPEPEPAVVDPPVLDPPPLDPPRPETSPSPSAASGDGERS